MRKPAAVIATVPVLALTGALLGGPASATHIKTAKVGVKDDFFDLLGKKKVVIRKGNQVKWVWMDDSDPPKNETANPHNVSGKRIAGESKKEKRFTSGSPEMDGSYTKRFRTTGKWRVICDVHPDSMRMTVTVK